MQTFKDICRFIVFENLRDAELSWISYINEIQINKDRSRGGLIFLNHKYKDMDFEPRKSIGLEASLLDCNLNQLHAILFMNKSKKIIALEVFIWSGELGKPDVIKIKSISVTPG